MSRCMRCGAGAEWLQGNPPKDNSALEAAEQRILALEAALQPFVRVNSSEETITIKVRTADITAARALLHDSQEEKPNA